MLKKSIQQFLRNLVKVAPRKPGGNKCMSIFPAKFVMYVSPGNNCRPLNNVILGSGDTCTSENLHLP